MSAFNLRRVLAQKVLSIRRSDNVQQKVRIENLIKTVEKPAPVVQVNLGLSAIVPKVEEE